MQGAARYVIWSYIFRDVDHAKVLDHLKGSGLLRRDADGRVLVLGLSAKVGDNLFSVDRRGREHRRYVDTLGRQGFYVNQRTQDAADTVHGFVAALPEADSTINRTWVRDGKFAAKPPALRKTEKRTILTHFRMAT